MSTPTPSPTAGQRPRILILGTGGIGGITAAHLFECGQAEVVPVSRNAAQRDAVARAGFRLAGLEPSRSVPGRIYPEIPPGPYDFVILATQPPEVEEAARTALPHLAPQGRIVCFQNGLCEERVAKAIGDPDRVIGAVVGWGGLMSEPGLYERTSSGGFALGKLDGQHDPALDRLARLLAPIGEVKLTPNLRGVRWSKLAINCAISSLGTVAGVRLGQLIQKRFARRFALEIFTECVEVARASGVRLEKVAGTLDVDWIALDAAMRTGRFNGARVRRHAIIYAVGLKFRRMRSSMLVALEKGRTPPVDFLNGEVVERAKALGLSAPANAAIQDAVWKLARKETTPSFPFLEEVFSRVARENGWR
jgi:2-dehydropantoate 2-reductase